MLVRVSVAPVVPRVSQIIIKSIPEDEEVM
jgi:hypothetical protein